MHLILPAQIKAIAYKVLNLVKLLLTALVVPRVRLREDVFQSVVAFEIT